MLYVNTVPRMCTNFTPTRKSDWVVKHFGIDLPAANYPVEAYPGYVAPLVVKSHQTGRMACGLARFGLIPAWAKGNKIGRHTYNARSETASTKPSYRTPWRLRQYGIVLVDNFFEPSYETGKAVRWCIEAQDGDPLGIACLWDRWIDPASGEIVASFSMLTVNADEHPVMRRFHRDLEEKRTPVALAHDQYTDWLGATAHRASEMMEWGKMPSLISGVAPRR